MISGLLSDHPDLDGSEIEVEVKDSEVFLTGHVSEKWAKRLAEDIVDSVTGVTHVENRIRVKQGTMTRSASG
jgi:osmotically-inducible protein OsmY